MHVDEQVRLKKAVQMYCLDHVRVNNFILLYIIYDMYLFTGHQK